MITFNGMCDRTKEQPKKIEHKTTLKKFNIYRQYCKSFTINDKKEWFLIWEK